MEKSATAFQEAVDSYLARHRSILDIISKQQQAAAGVERTLVKAVTNCGCIQINGRRQSLPAEGSLEEMRSYMETQLSGQLCSQCREALEKELGAQLFYTAALCNHLGLNLDEVMSGELERLETLGKYSLR